MNLSLNQIVDNQGLELVSALNNNGYWSAVGAETFSNWTFYDDPSWVEFARFWDDLLLDEYMRDGGTYRYRRYSQLDLNSQTGKMTTLPHAPYEQSAKVNTLNGGFQRHFEPLENAFLENTFFRGLMLWMGEWYSAASGHNNWNIKLHPYRIAATEGSGEPSPEGLHRDGVDYICSFMIRKCNVKGGETLITDVDENELIRFTLESPGDIMIGDDNTTKHGVSPIAIIETKKPVAYRDVLVIAFTKN